MLKNKNTGIFFAFLLLLCLVTYGDTLTHRFMLDERIYVKTLYAEGYFYVNPRSAIFSHYHSLRDFFEKPLLDHHYNPFNHLLNVGLFNVFQTPLPLYLINLVFFYINCGLWFVFIYLISRDFMTALLTAVIFCIHPMTGEMLQHITLNIIFVQNILMESALVFLFLYAKQGRPFFYYFLSLLMVFLALFCHEIALLFPLYAACVLVFLNGWGYRKVAKLILPFVCLSLLLVAIWMSMVNPMVHLEGMSALRSNGFRGSVANFSHIFFWYLGNLFIPQSIVFMRNMPLLKAHVWCWDLLFGVFLTGCGLLIGYFKRSLESFALVFFLTGFIFAVPASQTRPDMGVVFEPNWVYFSSIGFYLFIVLCLLRLKKYVSRQLYISLLCVLFMFYFISTLKLDIQSRTEISYCENWLRKSPGNTLAMGFVASFYNYHRQVEIPPDLIPDLLITADRYIEADVPDTPGLIERLSLSQGVSAGQKQELSWKLAAFYCRDGSSGQCRQSIDRIIGPKKDPYTYMLLASTFDKVGVDKQAVMLLKECMDLYPRYKEPYVLMGVILANEGRYKEAVDLWQRGLALDPADQRFISDINEAENLMNKKH